VTGADAMRLMDEPENIVVMWTTQKCSDLDSEEEVRDCLQQMRLATIV